MIQNSAMLIELNISMWTARKMDKRVSQEVDATKKTKARGGNYHKSLLAGTRKLDDVAKLVNAIRAWHYTNTLPWSDSGVRLLPMTNFMDYNTKLSEYETEFKKVVDDFLTEYPTLVSAAAFTLGDLFDSAEYPEISSLTNKFAFKYVYLPVPSTGDFRVDVEDAYMRDIQTQYESFYDTKLNDAMGDAWNRLHDCLTKLSTKLSEEEKHIFRDTLVSNAVDLCGLLTRLNVTNDTKLEAMRKQLEQALVGVTAKDLRENSYEKSRVKSQVDDLLSMF